MRLIILSMIVATQAWAAPSPPSGAHPRLFMSAANLAAFTQNATQKGTAAAALVAACQDTIDSPKDYSTRGGSDGNYWPGAAVNCAFAYLATQNAKFLTQAITYWQASLDDDQTLGDKLGCVAGVDTNWQSWNGNPPAPPVILTITHDTGYPMRWYATDIALTYDWLYSAPGVSSALLTQTRTCLTAWNDYYTANGYHHDQAGANYNAGYVIGKTLGAIAIGTDGGADGHLWNDTVSTIFAQLLVGDGLVGAADPVGQPAGALVGGDWLEGWQYGPLSVLEYAVAARALEENGVPQPDLDAWSSSLAVRYIHGTVPTLDGQWVGGDFDSDQVYQSPSVNELDAVLAGPSSDQAAAWAAYEKQQQSLAPGSYVYNALAELRTVTAANYRAQTPAPPLWYLSRGSRGVYARTAWDATAFWGVFSSAPHIVDDHEHFSAGNFVFTRGADHLVVDPSRYGEENTFETNAISVDADLNSDYTPSQTPWSAAELLWARGTGDAVYAARSDFAKAFIFADNPSTIPYAHREWVMLPEGEVVTVDRVQTADATHLAYLHFHANTGGTLKLGGGVASGTVGSSTLTIHPVLLSGGAPAITQPMVGDCKLSCSYPCGLCDSARFAVDEYAVQLPGPWAVAIHVFDGLAAGETATVGSLNDDNYDPAPKQNAGVIGAAVYRGSKQSYVVASSAMAGAAGATLSYAVPGDSAARHIVFDAPEDSTGSSTVSVAADSGRCAVTITAGSGFVGHPLMFQVASAADGCQATDGTNVPSASPPPGGGTTGGTTGSGGTTGTTGNGGSGGDGGSNGAKSSAGCGCVLVDGDGQGAWAVLASLLLSVGLLRRRRRRAC